MSSIVTSKSADWQAGLLAAERNEPPPFGAGSVGFADEPPVSRWTDEEIAAANEAQADAERNEEAARMTRNRLKQLTAACRERVKRAVPGCDRVNIERRDRDGDGYGFTTKYAVYVWVKNHVTPYWGEADTLTGAVAAAVNAATGAALARREAVGVTA